MDNRVKIEILDTPEKFYPMVDIILPPVLELLKKLSVLEREFYERDMGMEKEKAKAGIPHNETAPGSKELWKEYSERYGELVTPKCTEKLLKCGYGKSFGSPGEYDYLNTGCKVVFTMKSKRKVTIETFFTTGIDQRHQFIIRNIDNEWKIDEMNYGFSAGTPWHTYHI